MDFQEMQAHAGKVTIDQLCSGDRFKGLGALGRELAAMASQAAKENADHIHRATVPADFYATLRDSVVEKFTMDILGFNEPTKPAIAAATLVDTIYDAYIKLAEDAKLAAKQRETQPPKTIEDLIIRMKACADDKDKFFKLAVEYYQLEDTPENREVAMCNLGRIICS